MTASRTLVKSPPELWAECSDAGSLARHLGEFGEIRITRLEPETAVAWEGEQFSGTVRLEPSGWGTKVVISARAESEPQPEVVITEQESEPEEPVAEPTPPSESTPPSVSAPVRGGFLSRLLLARFGARAAPPPPPAPAQREPEPPPAPAPAEPSGPSGPEQHLHTALESLGQAHRRPFSRG